MKKDIYLAGGCFWGLEKFLGEIEGVLSTEVGYANGMIPNPSYEEVCKLDIHFVETVKVVYDNDIISLKELLHVFYMVIDPTSVNRQGNDVGEQYRSGIYYVEEKDASIIAESLESLQREYEVAIAIERGWLVNFYPAEQYHQKYLDKNPLGYCHIDGRRIKEAREYLNNKR